MKILKIFGVVVGIHVFLLVLVFAIPGCTSTITTAPTLADTAPQRSAPPPTISIPLATPADNSGVAPTVIAFNPDVPAGPAPVSAASGGARLVPTRPDTPVAGVLVAQPVEDVTPASSYIVKSGDNLWTIARKNNLTVAQLAAANSGLANNANLRPGQKLIIPKKANTASSATTKAADSAAAAATISSTKASDAMKHTVKSGETLGGIARTYGVKQGDIAVANNISDPAKIRPGMELVIPGGDPKSGKSAKAPSKSGVAAKTVEAAAPINLAPPAAAEVVPPAPPVVPVIRIGEGAAAPAPKR